MKKLMLLLLVMTLCICVSRAENTEVHQEGLYQYKLTPEGAVLTDLCFRDLPDGIKVIELPSTLGGQPVVGIGTNSLNTSMTILDNSFTLVIPEGVRYLEEDAFMCLHDAEVIQLPASLMDIPEYCFSHVSAEIELAQENLRYQMQDGFLIDRKKSTLLYSAPSSQGKPLPAVRRFGSGSLDCWLSEWDMPVIIPEGVEEIASYAFYDWVIGSLTLPDSLRKIESYAFECLDMTSGHVILPSSVVIVEFGAFGLGSPMGADMVIEISPGTRLENAAEYDIRMGEEWWSGEDELTTPTFRQGEFFFRLSDEGAVLTGWQPETSADEDIVLTIPVILGGQPVVGIGDCALAELRWFDNAAVILPEGLKWLHESAFADCWTVRSVTLPSTLESVPEGCMLLFEAEITLHPDNPYFTNVDGFLVDIRTGTLLYTSVSARGKPLPAVRRLGSDCTYNWITGWGEMDVIIPEGVEEIGRYAFYDAELKSLTLPENLRLIETQAFESFNVIELPIRIPAGVETLQYGAFGLSYQYGQWGLYESPDMIVPEGTSTHFETLAEYILRTGDTSLTED